jgi:hypothetical protein
VYIPDCQNAYLPQHGVHFLCPRAFGHLLDGIGGGRADGPYQHAGHPPRRDRWLASYPRPRNRLRRWRSNPLLSGPPRGSLPLFRPVRQTVLAAIGVIVLLPLGIYFLVRAVKEPLRAYASARQHWDEDTVPAHLVAEVAEGAALTIFNPFNHRLLGWRHLQLAPLRPLSPGLQRPRVGNPDGHRRPDDLVHCADCRR